MSFNQKAVLAMTVLAVGITVAIAFGILEPPYAANFWIGLSVLMASQILFGAFWIQQIARSNSTLPAALGVWGVNAVYFLFALAATLFTQLEVRYYVLLHAVGFAVFAIVHIFFYMVEHHVEEHSKGDEPEEKIIRAKVTWR